MKNHCLFIFSSFFSVWVFFFFFFPPVRFLGSITWCASPPHPTGLHPPPSSLLLRNRSASGWLERGALGGQAGEELGVSRRGGVVGFRGGGGSSVVCDRCQLGVQVHRDVLVEFAEGRVGDVMEVVEAVQVLPLFGIPQQFVPPEELHLSSVVVRN